MNPFDITKAVDYSDNELFNNWVDFPKDGFNTFIKPTSDMPMIILGSKGSGKTHIMKHFSFNMQQLRGNNVFETVASDGYIGIYLRCSGLNGYRFSGRNELPETWESIFSYYLDLWLTQLLLDAVGELFKSNMELLNYENTLVREIIKVFNSSQEIKICYDFESLKKFLNEQQRKVDYAINNISLTNESLRNKVEILTNPGQLIFEVPSLLTKIVKEFSNLKILLLLDEFENFSESQQKYFNTLIRERKDPVCFKIGARRYGIKTKLTFSANEELKLGSEYDLFDLDDIFRNNASEYRDFLREICNKRIENSQNVLKRDFSKHFEYSSYENDMFHIAEKGQHIFKFESRLKKLKIENFEKIVSNIRCKKNPLIERMNILLIYRGVKRKMNLFDLSELLRSYTKLYLQNKEVKEYEVILDKYKQDLIDALYRENNIKNTVYCGFENLARISNGIPRHFLMIMKHIFRWNTFYNNDNYKEKIKTNIQLLALKDTALWFLEDANTNYKNYNFKNCIEKLCDYLKEVKFSDLPPECSISTFEVEYSSLNSEIKKILDFLEQYSYLIKQDSGRRDKNSNQRNDTFQINGIIAAWWELSIARRGIFKISNHTFEKIFNENDDFKKILSSELIKYNVPFKEINNLPTLF